MKLIQFAGLVLVFLAAACAAPEQGGADEKTDRIVVDGQPLVDADGIMEHAVQEKLNADEGLCRSHGGAFQRVCMMGNTMCVVQFADGGDTCTDGAQCASGRCLADMSAETGSPAPGVCAPTNDPCGCFQRIEDGRAEPALCVD